MSDWYPLHCCWLSHGEAKPRCGECSYCLANQEIERLRAALARSDAMFRAITAYDGDELAEVYPFLADNARLLNPTKPPEAVTGH